MTLTEWLATSTKMHNGFYDYSLMVELSYKTKAKIICPVHGIFEQNIYTHVKGQTGCKLCRGAKLSNTKRLTQDQFIEKANKKYNSMYDYSKTVYVTGTQKVTIICPVHGEFYKRAEDHLNNPSGGCQFCGNARSSIKLRQTKEQFIKNAVAKHDSKYTYGNVIYNNSTTKVMITCAEHGDFLQQPQNHIQGDGCPNCGGDYTGPGVVYVLKCNNHLDTFKIGHTNNLTRRMSEYRREKDLHTNFGYDFSLMETYDVSTSRYAAEQAIHAALDEYRLTATGFTGCTEMFCVNAKIMHEVLVPIINEFNNVGKLQ